MSICDPDDSVLDNPPQTAARPTAWLILVGIAAAINLSFGIGITQIDFPNDFGVLIVAAFCGTIPTQFGMLAVWTTLDERPLATRMLWASSAAITLYGSSFFGPALGSTGDSHSGTTEWLFLSVGLSLLPALCLASQLPLLIPRIWFTWRFGKPTHGQTTPSIPKFGIRELLLSTTVVAVALGLPRMASALAQQSEFQADASLWLGLGIYGALFLGNSLFLVLPALLLICRSKDPQRGCAGFVVIAGGVMLAFLIVLLQLFGLGGMNGGVFAVFLMFVVGLVGSLAGAMMFLRANGYRLEWGRSLE